MNIPQPEPSETEPTENGQESVSGSLKEKQRAFCREYIVDLNATQAAIRAGYSKDTARQQGHRLLTNADIEAEVQRLMVERAERVELTADTVLRELCHIALADIGEAFDENGKLKPISEIPPHVRKAIAGIDSFEEYAGRGEDREAIGQTKKVRFWDKPKALELLGRHLKLYTDKVETETTVTVAGTTLSPDQIAEVERIRERREAQQPSQES